MLGQKKGAHNHIRVWGRQCIWKARLDGYIKNHKNTSRKNNTENMILQKGGTKRMNVKDVNKEKVIEQIDYYIENISTVQIDVMFVQKTQSRLNKYKALMFNCREKDIEAMVVETANNMRENLLNKEFDEYDLEVSVDDVVQVIEKEKVNNHEKLMKEITIEYSDENTVGEETDFGKFNFLILKISSNEEDRESLIFYKKHYKSPVKFKNTRSYIFNGKEPKIFREDLLIIGSNVDVLCMGSLFYIVNRNHFNSMLDFKDIYQRVVDSNEERIVECNVFENPKQFISDCKENGRHVVRLTKAILAKGFTNLENNKDRLSEILSNHNLNLELDGEGKIIYNKEHTGEILNLLLEHYVTSDLTNRRMLAKAIAKYE